MKVIILSLIVGIIFISNTLFLDANAVVLIDKGKNGVYISESQKIGIQISQSCIIMEKNHIKSNCLTYDKLKQFDNTNPVYAGQWVNDTWYHRLNPRVLNHEIMNLNNFVVMVDPNPDFTTTAKMIIVQSDNFTWINPNDSVGNNHTRIEHRDRNMSDCSSAIVAPNIWLINDTINYFESKCKNTKYSDIVLFKTGNQPFSFDNPYSSLYYKNFVSYSKQTGIPNCINHTCNLHTSKKNW